MTAVCQTEFKPHEIAFGAGTFSGAYNAVEKHWPTEACEEALRSGINLFDTSPYYGQSEVMLGNALYDISKRYPRPCYYLATKVGRYGYYQKDFDYSVAKVSESIKLSLERLRTDYIDIVYCHDVEFVSLEQVSGALDTLLTFKDQGTIKYVGISGYPLPCLLAIAEHRQRLGKPLDVVLSYCHYSLHDTTLSDYTPKLRAAGVRYILNASPLAMGLFRDEGPPEWHPSSPELQQAAKQAAALAKSRGLELTDLASTFAFAAREHIGVDATVIGLSNKDEVQKAIVTFQHTKAREEGKESTPLVEQESLKEIHAIFEPVKNKPWKSPTARELIYSKT